MKPSEGLVTDGNFMKIFPFYYRSVDVCHLPHLSVNEALVSRVVQLSPAGTEFLKPVVFEIPHFAAVKGKQRELVSFVYSLQTWREHATSKDDEGKKGFIERPTTKSAFLTGQNLNSFMKH